MNRKLDFKNKICIVLILSVVLFISFMNFNECFAADPTLISTLKGAFEKIIPSCKTYYNENGIKKLFIDKKKVIQKIESITSRGYDRYVTKRSVSKAVLSPNSPNAVIRARTTLLAGISFSSSLPDFSTLPLHSESMSVRLCARAEEGMLTEDFMIFVKSSSLMTPSS